MKISNLPIGRRPFIAGSVLLTASFASRLRAQTDIENLRRAAVVIGLDSYPDLPHLRAAVSGAEQMAAFLRDEGFQTTLFTDRDRPVTGSEIFNVVADHVEDPAGLDQLVIYFAGHGFLSGTNEFWLLSGAPRDTAEAVSVLESAELAYLTDIASVVIISDACRTIPEDIGMTQVTGRKIFPSGRTPQSSNFVDLFFGTLPGKPSLELPTDKAFKDYEGIFTTALLEAFRRPTRDMIYDYEGEFVIPNRRLRNFLVAEVSRRAQEHSISLNQFPYLRINSDIPTFIGRSQISPGESETASHDATPEKTLIPEAIRKEVQRVTKEPRTIVPASVNGRPINPTVAQTQAFALIDGAVGRQQMDKVLSSTGLVVYGARIEQIFAPDLSADRSSSFEDGETWQFHFVERTGASIGVLFEGGRSAILPLLENFGTHVTMDAEGIIDIRFNPSEQNDNFDEYEEWIDILEQLRGLASEATRQDVLTFEGSPEERQAAAWRFAGSVRMGKGMDPTLGIYAAYAYSSGFMEDGVRSIHDIMVGSLRAEIFDVLMLAGGLTGRDRPVNGAPLVPFVPMLRQGWEYLRVKDVAQAELLFPMRAHLENSLWTCFRSGAFEKVLEIAEANGGFGGNQR